MESQLNKLDGIDNATIDFVSRKLIIESKGIHEFNRIIEEANKIIKRIEPDVKLINVKSKHEQESEHVHHANHANHEHHEHNEHCEHDEYHEHHEHHTNEFSELKEEIMKIIISGLKKKK